MYITLRPYFQQYHFALMEFKYETRKRVILSLFTDIIYYILLYCKKKWELQYYFYDVLFSLVQYNTNSMRLGL